MLSTAKGTRNRPSTSLAPAMAFSAAMSSRMPGTPLGGERQYGRQQRSPEITQEVKKLRGGEFPPAPRMPCKTAASTTAGGDQVDSAPFTPPGTPPRTPPGVTPTSHQDLLGGISALLDRKFDERLIPIVEQVGKLESEVAKLSITVADDKKHTDDKLDTIQSRLQVLESSSSSSMQMHYDPNSELQNKVQELEKAVRIIKEPSSEDSRMVTALVGGLKELGNVDDAFKFVSEALWSTWAPHPQDHYTKGEFQGILFLKFPSREDRDVAIESIKKANITHSGNKIWAKPDLALSVRMKQGFLCKMKNMMVGWGYDPKSLWVNVDEGSLQVGFDTVLTSKVEGTNFNVDFTSGDWRTEIMCEEFEKAREESEAELKKRQQPTKGLGKGKAAKRH